jgi:predicted AlkP superfamily pyrophosphatase or phosphodiesterase
MIESFGVRLSCKLVAMLGIAVLCVCANLIGSIPATAVEPEPRRVIIYVWDGFRPDSVNPMDTPNLYAMREAGVDFTDNHATYPTFTMMNAASFATGSFGGATGYYGNTLWQSTATGKDSADKTVDYQQPVFTEDYAILTDLSNDLKGDLFMVETLFSAAQKAGMSTVTVGKSGAAFIQDYKRGGMMLDEKTVLPLSLARELQQAGIRLPALTANSYSPGEMKLVADNGDPTAFGAPKRLKDGVTFDPTDTSGSPFKAALDYMFDTYVNYILPMKKPTLSVVWMRDPDTNEHLYGPGTANALDGIHANDRRLGKLRAKLRELGWDATTDIIVVSDHAHSSVAGSEALFPLRAIKDGTVGNIDPGGYSVSGMVRLAELMHRAGFANVFDGLGCSYLPVSTGVKADGATVYPVHIDEDGSVCGKAGQKYNSGPFLVPTTLPPQAIVIAVNGGSDYIYVPDHDRDILRKIVGFLETRDEVGTIFVDSRYGDVPGTIPLSLIRQENKAGRSPDIIVGFDWDDKAVVSGMSGTEYSGILLNNPYRGMHGDFSPIDVHNTLIAFGPDFRENMKDLLPTGNVDVAPTLANILGLKLPRADGRPVLEALRNGPSQNDYQVTVGVQQPRTEATGLTVKLPTDPDGKDVDKDKSTFTFNLYTKALSYKGNTYLYFDKAKVARQ